MKKKYVKPEIMFENFTLSNHVAGDCELKPDTQNNNDCGLFFEGVGNVFLSGMGGCKDEQVGTDDGSYNTICYHVPDGYNLFNS